MSDDPETAPEAALAPSAGERLGSWKAIAGYLKRGVRTVRRWEKEEGLPVHRHLHESSATVYAFASEIDAWVLKRRPADRKALVPARARRHRPLLAVLPFDNLSGDPAQDYLSDGFTEDLITDLARLGPKGLGVIARTSVMRYKGTTESIAAIGEALGVEYVLEGSVRREGECIRINAQLIHVDDQTHLWAERYDRPLTDILEVQSDLAGSIADSVQVRLERRREMPGVPGRISPEAYEAYLKGRFLWHTRTVSGFERAIGQFERAIALQPDFARCYAGMADCYALLGSYNARPMPATKAQAKALARRALELNPAAGEVHASIGQLEDYDWNWSGAEVSFERAVELAPGYATAHQWYAEHLGFLDRTDEALGEARLARELDPMSPAAWWVAGGILYYARRFDEARGELADAASLFPHTSLSYLHLGLAQIQAGQHDEALASFARGRALAPDDPELAAMQAYGLGAAGNHDQAATIRDRLEAEIDERSIPPFFIAVAHLGLGDTGHALDWLERAHAASNWQLAVIYVDPIFDPLRGRPRFESLLGRMNFPAR